MNIMVAAETGDLDTILSLLGAGTDVDETSGDGRTALMLAAANGHKEMVRLLIQHGADINKADSQGNVPIVYAARADQVDVVNELVDIGANLDITGNRGASLLKIAFRNRNQRMVDLFLSVPMIRQMYDDARSQPV